MTKAQIISLVQHILSAVGGVIVAHGVASSSIVSEISGTILAVVSLVYSIKDKSATVSMVETTIHQVLTAVGGFLTFVSPAKTTEVIGTIMAILPAILAQISGLKDDTVSAAATPVDTKVA